MEFKNINESKDAKKAIGFDERKYLTIDESEIVDTKTFVENAKRRLHGDAYDYSKTNFVSLDDEVIVTCKKHGDFRVNARKFLTSFESGCRRCRNGRMRSIEKAIKDILIIYGDKGWDFSISTYKGSKKKFKLICPVHGVVEHEFQNFNSSYRRSCCKYCNNIKDNSSSGERIARAVLDKYGVKYETQKTFSNLKDIKHLRLDFFIEDIKTVIEIDGLQHYVPVKYFGGDEAFERTKSHDFMKETYCKENGYTLLRISYQENIEVVLYNKVILPLLKMGKISGDMVELADTTVSKAVASA